MEHYINVGNSVRLVKSRFGTFFIQIRCTYFIAFTIISSFVLLPCLFKLRASFSIIVNFGYLVRMVYSIPENIANFLILQGVFPIILFCNLPLLLTLRKLECDSLFFL